MAAASGNASSKPSLFRTSSGDSPVGERSHWSRVIVSPKKIEQVHFATILTIKSIKKNKRPIFLRVAKK